MTVASMSTGSASDRTQHKISPVGELAILDFVAGRFWKMRIIPHHKLSIASFF
jgi:hypothetical protein